MLRLIFHFSLLISLLFVCAQVEAAVNFDQQITDLLHQKCPQATLGMVVIDPETNTIVYARRATENFYPASNTKLFTASAALQLLGPDFQYKTTLGTTPSGDLHVVFTGDPSFTSQDLLALFKQLKAQNISHITGNIVIDDTAFEGSYYGPGWTYDSIIWGYSAPVSAIIIDENKVVVRLEKPKQINTLIPLQKQNAAHPAKLTANVKAVTREEAKNRCPIQANCLDNHFVLQGCYPFEDTPTILELAIDSPKQLAQQWIAKYLAALQITLDGQIIFGKAPNDLSVLAVKQSPPLSALIIPVLSDSNNLYAESITKTLGRHHSNRGSFQAGTQAVQAILGAQLAAIPAPYRLRDGSGQSRYNLVSPMAIGHLLNDMRHDPHFEHFNNALSVGGVSGTLAPYMQNDLKGKVFAKTGGATGTSTLSGYIIAQSGKPYVFSIMLNQIAQDSIYSAKEVQEKLCQSIAKEPWIETKPQHPLIRPV